MIKTTRMLVEEMDRYRYPMNRISRLVQQGKLYPIVRGLYETDATTPGYLLAGSIYGPSYLSFDFALAYYQLIPELVQEFSSATIDKNKRARFSTPFGVFSYRNVPSRAYPAGIRLVQEGTYSYLIADAEKAICDKLYTLPPNVAKRGLETLLFEDLRIDPETFEKLEPQKLEAYAGLYRSRTLKLFTRWLEGKG